MGKLVIGDSAEIFKSVRKVRDASAEKYGFVHDNELFNVALTAALDAHENQTDLAGIPTIYHVLRVMSTMRSSDGRICALLHDVLEDSPRYTAQSFIDLRIPNWITDAVVLLTQPKDMSYKDYIHRLVSNIHLQPLQSRLAVAVKFHDMKDNVARLFLVPNKKDRKQKTAKYDKAYPIIQRAYESTDGHLL